MLNKFIGRPGESQGFQGLGEAQRKKVWREALERQDKQKAVPKTTSSRRE